MAKKEYDEIKIIDNAISVGRKANHIKEIARALNRVGMQGLAVELINIADDLELLGEETRVLASCVITAQLNNATATTDTILCAVLSGLSASQGDKE